MFLQDGDFQANIAWIKQDESIVVNEWDMFEQPVLAVKPGNELYTVYKQLL